MSWVRHVWTRRLMSAFFLVAFLWGASQWVHMVFEAKPPKPIHATHAT